MEDILNLGIGDGVFHIHEIEVFDTTRKLFATISLNTSDITDPIDLSEKQSHIAHQCALMKRNLKSCATVYYHPSFPNLTLSPRDDLTFKGFLDTISKGCFPDIRLTEECIRMLGAINALVGKKNFNKQPYTDSLKEVKPKPPFITPKGPEAIPRLYSRQEGLHRQLSVLPNPIQQLEQ